MQLYTTDYCTFINLQVLLLQLTNIIILQTRLLSMRLDIEDSVAVVAINVLEHMQNLKLLEMDECQEVCELLFLESRGISHAAGQFAISYFFSEDFMSKAKVKRPPKGAMIHSAILVVSQRLY